MGSNTIIAIVVGAILVIVGFSLWPVLNGSTNGLYCVLQETACDDGNGNRFFRGYVGARTVTVNFLGRTRHDRLTPGMPKTITPIGRERIRPR